MGTHSGLDVSPNSIASEGPLRRVVVVRHGRAGSRAQWRSGDENRPLDATGFAQALWLVGVLIPISPRRIISSPYLRCRQTVEPLAKSLSIDVELSSDLVPEAQLKSYELIREMASAPAEVVAVLCTHGETMRDALRLLATNASIELEEKVPGVKGCAWTLDFLDGSLSSANCVTPPQLLRLGMHKSSGRLA